MRFFFTILFAATLTISVYGQADSSKYAIITFYIDNTAKWPFEDCKPTDLTKNDINDITDLMKQCVNNYNAESKQKKGNVENTINLESYKQQFIAVINKKGEKEVWINCFCNNSHHPITDWKKEIVVVRGGGSCYFNLKINLATKKYYNLIINCDE